MRVSPRSPLLWLIGFLLAAGCGETEKRGDERDPARVPADPPGTLSDGVYAVIRESSTRDSAEAGGGGRVVLVHDHKYSDAAADEPPTYVAIDPSSRVPLILEAAPDTHKDDSAHTVLSVTLARRYVKELETFTAANLGRHVAIVLDGEIVTIHKVRSVIHEGKVQISRCNDNACDILLSKLTD